MSDIFREVEEDIRRERLEKLWKAYGSYAVAALVLLFAGIGGWQFWQRHELQERQKFSDSFIAAQRISNPQTAASTFADLARNAPKGYGAVARLSQAGAMFASGQRGGAIDLYKQIAKDESGPIGSVARLRAAWGIAETASRAELAELLKPLDEPGNAWRPNAREVLAYADYRAMDTKSALTKYNELALAPESPNGVRARAKAMADFLKNGGAISYGSVPADAVPAAQGPVADPNPPAPAK
ncbi:MAG TPA: tetratricopeptide repeat protein [Rhizomicrobium sp.]|nr:tetratricopeptide repeat protein [Rhizomicrobium sp.]